MERNRRYFGFQVFSSAEAIRAFGLDNLVRLGVSFVWIGVESADPAGNYAKNEGVDARLLTRELRDRGITVLASGILCAEHHTPENIQADVDFMVGLEADMVQFMLLTPLPVTALYRDLEQRGLLREELPWEEWHGQKELSWRHPAFPGDAPASAGSSSAFRADHEANSSSTMYRVVETAFRGWRRLAALPRRDACLEHRMARLARRTLDWMPLLADAVAQRRQPARAGARGAPGGGDRGGARRLRGSVGSPSAPRCGRSPPRGACGFASSATGSSPRRS